MVTEASGNRAPCGRARLSGTTAIWKFLLAAVVALSVVVAAGSGVAFAGAPGVWSDVTGDTGTNLTQASTARVPDGTLWVAYAPESGVKHDLRVRPITAAGALGATVSVQAGWGIMHDPAIVRLPSGELRIFFAGIRSAYTGDPYSGLTYATSADGTSWTLAPGDIDYPPSSSAGSDIGATVLPSGTAFQTWTGTFGVWVHRDYAGLPGTEFEYQNGQLGGCCGYYSNLAADLSGAVWIAWASNATGKEGVWAQQVDVASGAPVAGPVELAGSSTVYHGTDSFNMMSGRVPMAARPAGTGGVYVAYPCGYPFTPKIKLWRLGAGSGATIVSTKADKDFATVAADPEGRLWVVWSEKHDGRPVIVATRSNRKATVFGATAVVKAPKQMEYLWHLTAAAQPGRLDVLAHLSGGSTPESTWHTQLLAGLSAKTVPAGLKVGKRSAVTVTVTDAGDPVPGATVKLGGKTAKTGANGKATIKLGPYGSPRTLKGSASKTGFGAAVLGMKVKK